jgi:hypothetical protein
MEKSTLLGLGIAGAGVAGAKYFDTQARKTSGQEQINNGKISKYSSVAIPIGLGIAAYNGLLKGHPNRIAIAVIPVGLFGAFITNFGFDADISNKPTAKIGKSLGLATAIGGLTYLISKNSKTSLLVGGLSAALIYANSEYNSRNLKQPYENTTTETPVEINTLTK